MFTCCFNDALVYKLGEFSTLVKILKWRGSLVHERYITDDFKYRFNSLFGSDSSPLVSRYPVSQQCLDIQATQ